MSRIAAPGLPLNAAQIAEAAAREVGNGAEFWLTDGVLRARGPNTAVWVSYKASLLGRMGTGGPDYMVYCLHCAEIVNGVRRGAVRCISVADALRGRTCKENP